MVECLGMEQQSGMAMMAGVRGMGMGCRYWDQEVRRRKNMQKDNDAEGQ